MKSQWFKGCKESEKERVKKEVKSSKPALDRLASVLQDRLDSSVKEMSSRSHFDSASWEAKMAHYLGEQDALRSVITLLDIEDK